MSGLKRLRVFGSGNDLPPGPANVEQMFCWADNTWQHLSAEQRTLLIQNFDEGLELLTYYSGKGSAESIFHQIASRVTQEKSGSGQPVETPLRVSSACDCKPLCRQVLCALKAGKPEHIFGNVCSRIEASVREAVEKMLPVSEDSPQQKAAAYERIRGHLFAAGRQAFNPCVKSYCYVHGRACPLWDSVDVVNPTARDKLVVAAAGSCCTDYSPRRTGEAPGLSGPTTYPFHAWIGEMKVLLPDLIYYENVPNFPAHKFDEWLPEYANHNIVASPVDYGFPVSRRRIFGLLVLKETVSLDLDMPAFEAAFKRRCCTNADSFCVAPPEDVLAAYEDRARSRGNFIRRTGSREAWTTQQLLSVLDLSKVVTPTMLNRLADYERLLADRSLPSEACCVFDLDQNAGYSGVSDLIPSVPTHSSLYSRQKGRLLTGNECLASYGENLYHHSCGPESLLPRGLLDSLTEKQKQFLCGNSWHIPIFGQFIMFSLAHVRKIPKPARQLLSGIKLDFGARSSSFQTDAGGSNEGCDPCDNAAGSGDDHDDGGFKQRGQKRGVAE